MPEYTCTSCGFATALCVCSDGPRDPETGRMKSAAYSCWRCGTNDPLSHHTLCPRALMAGEAELIATEVSGEMAAPGGEQRRRHDGAVGAGTPAARSRTRSAAQPHERTTIRSAMGEAAWCLRGMLWHLLVPLRRVPACRFGLHEWCDCCSPHFCVRCEKRGPE